MQLRRFLDAVNWAAIPLDTSMVGGYVRPSPYAWPPEAWAAFHNAVQIRITPSATVARLGVQVLDVERGDASPDQVPGWCEASRSATQEPTVYTGWGQWADVIRACLAARIPMPQFWVALWNGTQDLPTIVVDGITYTATAHQYADPTTSGGQFDASVAAPYWPGVDPIPEETVVTQLLVPAGQNEHVTFIVDGCDQIYFGSSYGDGVEILQLDWWGATPNEPAPAAGGIGGERINWSIDDNRPGGVPIPAGAVSVSIRYNATHTWTLAARSN